MTKINVFILIMRFEIRYIFFQMILLCKRNKRFKILFFLTYLISAFGGFLLNPNIMTGKSILSENHKKGEVNQSEHLLAAADNLWAHNLQCPWHSTDAHGRLRTVFGRADMTEGGRGLHISCFEGNTLGIATGITRGPE